MFFYTPTIIDIAGESGAGNLPSSWAISQNTMQCIWRFSEKIEGLFREELNDPPEGA